MPQQSEVGNQLKSQSLAEVLSTSFTTVGNRVFPDTGASQSILDLILVVDSWRATHLTSYGSVAPNTGTGYTGTGVSTGDLFDLVSVSDNEVVRLNGVSIENIDSSTIGFEIVLGDTLLHKADVAANTHVAIEGLNTIVVSKGQALQVRPTSGTANRLNAYATGAKTCVP